MARAREPIRSLSCLMESLFTHRSAAIVYACHTVGIRCMWRGYRLCVRVCVSVNDGALKARRLNETGLEVRRRVASGTCCQYADTLSHRAPRRMIICFLCVLFGPNDFPVFSLAPHSKSPSVQSSP